VPVNCILLTLWLCFICSDITKSAALVTTTERFTSARHQSQLQTAARSGFVCNEQRHWNNQFCWLGWWEQHEVWFPLTLCDSSPTFHSHSPSVENASSLAFVWKIQVKIIRTVDLLWCVAQFYSVVITHISSSFRCIRACWFRFSIGVLAHDSIYAERAICCCPTVRLSVCLSHGWISRKRLKLGSCNFHHTLASSL